ncbi:hypothetical protein BTXL6_10935 [Bacillus thuringiensis]|nr:hypothetical protein BTXL6_28500 [Bacillus thuringiensis]ALL21935.1 hypothetical protein BTXL6_10935 [Bacillus thuringiensis]EEM19250.1 hypothetical protein bthur0001_56150 [Bacillus thuringiensis serovar tochigiensis BGSC 4Y1]
MMNTDVKIYGIKTTKGLPVFIKREIMAYQFLDVMNRIEELNIKFDMDHIAIPIDIPISVYSNEIIVMQRHVKRYVKRYTTDFYAADMSTYFQMERNVIWILRENGTNMVAVANNEDLFIEALQLIEHHADRSKAIFHINNGQFKRLTPDQAIKIVRREEYNNQLMLV